MSIPKLDGLFNPLLQTLHKLGGSASNSELVDEVAQLLDLSDQELDEQTSRGQPKFAYWLAWARSYLKIYGLITNSKRGIWSLTPAGIETNSVDPVEVKRFVRSRNKTNDIDQDQDDPTEDLAEDPEWRGELLRVLLDIEPAQFERLCQRILRESGFVQVEVTGRSGDGGIDGIGMVELGDLLTFPIAFQCKRYRGNVGPNIVREFRGAMDGRADRGLILTPSLFTREARREAQRDGAIPVELIDRERLLDKLKTLSLGIRVELVEDISIDVDWFKDL